VAAFRATLEELTEATLLLHVVDITHPDAPQQSQTVEATLGELELTGNLMNDAKCDPTGALWVGRMALDGAPGLGSLLRLDPDLRLTLVEAGLAVPNGMAWSTDGRRMYFIDSMRRLAAEGMGIVFATADLADIQAAATRVLVMARGRITADYPVREATADALASAASSTPRGGGGHHGRP